MVGPSTGYSCHQCKSTKRQDLLLFCSKGISDKKKRKCRKKYCDSCLRRLYSQSVHTVEQKDMWQCPSCQYRCTCANCKRRDPSQAGSLSVGGEVGDSDEDSDADQGTPMSPMLHGLDRLPTNKRRASSHSHAAHRAPHSHAMLPASIGLPPLTASAVDPLINTRLSTKRKDRDSVHQSMPSGITSWSIPASTLNVDANNMFDDQQLQTLLANQRAVSQSYDATAFAHAPDASIQQVAYDSTLLHQYTQQQQPAPMPHGTPARELPPPLTALQDTLNAASRADLMTAMLALSPIDTQHLLSAVQQSVHHSQQPQANAAAAQHQQPIPAWPAMPAMPVPAMPIHHSPQPAASLNALHMPTSRATSAASFYQTELRSVQASPADATAQVNNHHLQAAMNQLVHNLQQMQQQQQQSSHDNIPPAVNLAALIESVANQTQPLPANSWSNNLGVHRGSLTSSQSSHTADQALHTAMQPTSSPVAMEPYTQSQQLDVNVGDVVSPTAATGLMSLSLQNKDDTGYDLSAVNSMHNAQNSNRFTFSAKPSRPTSATMTGNGANAMLQSSPSDKFLPGSSEAIFMFSPIGTGRKNSLSLLNGSPPNSALQPLNGTPMSGQQSQLPAGLLSTADLVVSSGFAPPSLSRPMSMLNDLGEIGDFTFTG